MKENKCFVIAELSANHGGDIEIAKETIRAAKRTGADAIKLQTYLPSTMTLDSDKEDFIVQGGTIWDGRNLYELYQEASLPWEWHKELFDLAKEEDIICFSTPFDKSAEISFIMKTELEKKSFKQNWEIFLDLLEQVAFKELNFHKIYTYAFDIRPQLYQTIEKLGYKREATLKDHSIFGDKYIDVIIH